MSHCDSHEGPTPPTKDQDRFTKSCGEAVWFPRNLVYHDSYDYNLQAYVDRLDEREAQLFCDREEGIIDIWDYDDQLQKFNGACIHGVADLKTYLEGDELFSHNDPQCRFFFIHAPHSREWLSTSRHMLTYALTYHQVMPAFLDFLFPFGRQEYTRDFHFSGFHEETRLSPLSMGLSIPELGRSGRDIRMCYSLKSVEVSNSQPNWPWSVRQTAVYHSFDIVTGKATWITIKGNKLMKKRLESATSSTYIYDTRDFSSEARAFASSLSTHLIICDWCGKEWRWYISFLEEAFEERTRRTLAVRVVNSTSTIPEKKPSHSLTWTTLKTLVPEKRSFRSRGFSKSSAPMSPPEPPSEPRGRDPPTYNPSGEPINENDFSFNDLQRVQSIEDKTNEVHGILESNMNVLTNLRMYYQSTIHREPLSDGLRQECARDIARFENRISSIIKDLKMQQSRIQTLLRLLADRKNLLYGILNYRSMEASKKLAMKAQQSAESMESMTRDMHILAQKTTQETVSMKIITLVTLFFLPGTFISTIMSTDIVRWNDSHRVVQLGAIELYLEITIPLMLITFGAWYGVYWWVDRRESFQRRQNQSRLSGETI